MFFSQIRSKFEKFDLRQLQKSIYSGTDGVHNQVTTRKACNRCIIPFKALD